MSERECTPTDQDQGTQNSITNLNIVFDVDKSFGKPLTAIHECPDEWQEYQDDQVDFLRWCQH